MSDSGVTNLGGFNDFIEDAVGDIEEDAKQLVTKLGADIWTKIKNKTPVDTGRARQSWNFQWGAIDPSVPDEGEYDDPSLPNPGSPEGKEVLHISSNLNYIIFLEEGVPGPGSKDAPQGMVQVTLQEVESEF
jgi:hypothetical protein